MKKSRRLFLHSDTGSVLLAVLVVTLVLSIILITVQPMMLSYVKRGVFEYQEKQAELSARSSTKAILTALVNGNSALESSVNALSSVGEQVAISSINFQKSNMGNVTAKIVKLSDDTYAVSSLATVGDAKSTITANIIKNTGPSFTPEGFSGVYVQNISISQGGFIVDDATDIMISNSMSMSGQSYLDIGKNLIILPDSSVNVAGNSEIIVADYIYTLDGTFSITGSSTVYLQGTAYTKANSPLRADVAETDIHYCPYIRVLTQEMIQAADFTPNWVKYTGETMPTSGLLERGQYYTVTGSQTITSITDRLASDVTAIFPVFIIVKNNSNFTISQPVDPPIDGVQSARVYFILEGNAQLTIPAGSCITAYGGPDSVINVSGSGTETQQLYGQICVGTINNLNNHSTTELTYVPINIGGSSGDDIFVPSNSGWKIDKYTNEEY